MSATSAERGVRMEVGSIGSLSVTVVGIECNNFGSRTRTSAGWKV